MNSQHSPLAQESAAGPIELLTAENRLLELATRNTPLPEILDVLARSAEQLVGRGARCSILLLDRSGRRLVHGAAPNLPVAYNHKIHGIEIGPGVGSCGTAAACGKEVVVSDIATHPYWAAFKALAMEHGLRACWSTPILSSGAHVLGTFAIYYNVPYEPEPAARSVVQMLSRTAALVIERSHLHEQLTRKIIEHTETQDLLRTAQQTGRLAVWQWNIADDSMVFAPGGAEIFPVALGDMQTRAQYMQQVAREDREHVQNVALHAIEKCIDFESEFRVQVNGEEHWLLCHCRPVIQQATCTHVVGVTADITSRKQVELELVRSRESFRRAQQAANLGSWTWDIPTGKLEYSVEVPSFQGLGGDFDAWWERIHPDDRAKIEPVIKSAMENGGDIRVEGRLILNPADQPRWFLTTGRIETVDGQAVRGAGITLDITEQRMAEQQKRQAEARFRMVLESSAVGFWYCDLPFDKLTWDAKVKEHFWLEPEDEVTIDLFYARLHPEDRERTRTAIQQSTEARKPYDVDYRTVNPATGEEKWIRAVGRTTFHEKGHPVSFDGITMDLTERRRAENALRASEKLAATGRLAATIAHEINNPLEAVTNFIFLAKNNKELPASVKHHLEIADQELARVSHIAQQTLGFYRDTTAPVRMDMATLLDDVLLIYERRMMYKSIRIERDYAPGLRIVGYKGELRQVFSNLLANAIDASNDDQHIIVRARIMANPKTGERELRVSVADDGVGIHKQDQRRIFEPFFTTKQAVGTGLGLWVTRGIIQKHRGRIVFRSRCTGNSHGTVFCVALPINHVQKVEGSSCIH